MEKKLIIVNLEDNLFDFELNLKALDREGLECEMIRVETKEAFLEAIEQGKPDIILADYSLPSFDGISAMELAQKYHPDLPFIFVSGGLGEELAIETLKKGAVDYVLKDRLMRLGTAVRRALIEKDSRTKRLKAEALLIKSEEKYRTILETIEEIYFEVDLAGNLIFFNKAMIRTFGRTRKELMGLNYREYTSPEEAKRLFSVFNDIFRTGLPGKIKDLEVFDKSGAVRRIEGSAYLLRDSSGNPIGFRGILFDRTDQKQMEDDLKISEERYCTIIEEIEEGYYELDLKGNYTFVNDFQVRLLGYSRDEMIGMNYRMITPPEKVKEGYEIYNRVYQTGGIIKKVNLIQIRKDGIPLIVENSISPLRNRQGVIVGFRGISRDSTESKRAEEQILASLKEKEILLREIHHRVKNNLQVVQSLLNLQAGKMKDPLAIEAFRDSRDRIRAMALVHEKLYQSVNLAFIDMSDYLKNLGIRIFHSSQVYSDLVQFKVEARDIHLGVDMAVPVGLIVTELISNALKYAFHCLKKEGSGKEGKGELFLRFSQGEGNFILIVADNGIGLPEEIDLSTTDSLGFQLVTALVEQLHGTIEVIREKGTAFRITFPEG